MGLDIRSPMGLMFVVLGVVLLLAGLSADPSIYRKSLGINVNLWWGLVLLVFGGAMLLLARRGTRREAVNTAGLAIEERERREGLESEGERRA